MVDGAREKPKSKKQWRISTTYEYVVQLVTVCAHTNLHHPKIVVLKSKRILFLSSDLRGVPLLCTHALKTRQFLHSSMYIFPDR